MTITQDRPGPAAEDIVDNERPMPSWGPLAVLAAAAVVSGAVFLLLGFNPYGFAVLTLILYSIAIVVVSRMLESKRKATDRFVTALVWSAFGLAMIPLVSVVWTVVSQGIGRLDPAFFTETMRGVIGEGGGAAHAIVGTLLVTGVATIISVPVGLMTAVYLVEYGRGRLARSITFFVDVMTGIPSIVAGLFAYALLAIFFGPGVRMGIGGSLALSVLMIPVVVRTCEEMLKLVPNELREASYALGVPRWRTIVKVVIPTSIAGIATGITLAIARVIGETAPLLIIAGTTNSMNTNPTDGRMSTLPVFTYYSYTQPGVPPEPGIERAWTAALVLIIIVMGLNILARLISRLFAPKTGR